jgi:hypothetical protein
VYKVGLKSGDQNIISVLFFLLTQIFPKYILIFSITLQFGLLRSMVVTLFNFDQPIDSGCREKTNNSLRLRDNFLILTFF